MVAPPPADMPTLAPRQTRRSPDRRRSTKIKILIAVIGSLLLHVVLLFVLGWVVPHWPHAKLPHGNPPPIHLTFTQSPPAPSASPAPATGNRPEYMRTLDEQKADHAPDTPNFISDKDTLAASELPANGDKPLPNQDGRNVPSLEFDTRPNRDGKVAQDAASAAPAAPPPDTQPRPTPEAKKPAPHTKALHPPKPPSTPNPAGELATLKADTSPTPEPPTPAETPDDASAPPIPRQSQNVSTNPSVNSRGLPQLPGYQPQTIKTKATGGISNRGLSAVAAVGTPLGRYEKEAEDAIGMLWYQLADQHMDAVAPGSVKVHFYVTRQGKVRDLRVISGHQNGVLADISVEAITDAPLPPIPPEVADMLPGGELEFDGFVFEFLTGP